MFLLKEDQHNEISDMGKQWITFKKRRKNGQYDYSQGDGFITSNEREKFLDRLFKIIIYQTKKV